MPSNFKGEKLLNPRNISSSANWWKLVRLGLLSVVKLASSASVFFLHIHFLLQENVLKCSSAHSVKHVLVRGIF